MLLASSWPPSVTASNTICMQKPRATPMRTCCTVTTMPAAEKGAMSGGRGNQRRDDQCDATGETRRTRGGTNCAPNAGATMKQDPTRTNGQKTWAIQVSSCPVVRVIMACQGGDQLISDGMLSNSSRV